jgi:hypothetical protein
VTSAEEFASSLILPLFNSSWTQLHCSSERHRLSKTRNIRSKITPNAVNLVLDRGSQMGAFRLRKTRRRTNAAAGETQHFRFPA